MVQKANNDSEILNLNYRKEVDKVKARVLSVQLIFFWFVWIVLSKSGATKGDHQNARHSLGNSLNRNGFYKASCRK